MTPKQPAPGTMTKEEARAAMETVLLGEATEAEITALLTGLRARGETVEEIVGFAEAMRAHATPVFDETNPRPEGVLVDTCGTGGDNAGLFNISTAAALVVAATGVPVAKHGNRSISSQCGSADVLEALGVKITLPPEQVAACIREVGFGFLFAPHFHASTRHAQPVRKKLGSRTVFNLLGPLTNPAGVDAQVVGVYDERWLGPMAEALGQLGVHRAFVVHSQDGLDEVSLSAPTNVAEWKDGTDGTIQRYTITPEEFGVERAPREALQGGDAAANAAILRRIFSGEPGPQTDVVLLNASLALVAAGAAEDFRSGAERARAAIQSGAVDKILDALTTFTNK